MEQDRVAAVPPGGSRGAHLAVAAALFVLVGLFLFAVARSYRAGARRPSAQLRCTSLLRALALARLQFVADRRVPLREHEGLAGDVHTADGPRALRKLFAAGYLDEPADVLCPAVELPGSPDHERAAVSEWLLGKREDLPAGQDTLATMVAVSYGWTRRPLGPSAGAAPLAADKAALPRDGERGALPGNHVGWWNVVDTDAVVQRARVEDEPFPGERLPATEDPSRDGFLGIFVQDRASLRGE